MTYLLSQSSVLFIEVYLGLGSNLQAEISFQIFFLATPFVKHSLFQMTAAVVTAVTATVIVIIIAVAIRKHRESSNQFIHSYSRIGSFLVIIQMHFFLYFQSQPNFIIAIKQNRVAIGQHWIIQPEKQFLFEKLNA